MRRVLSLVWYKVLPPVFGGQRGIALFSEYLSRHVHLHMLCADDNETTGGEHYVVDNRIPRGKWQFTGTKVSRLLKDVLSQDQFSHLILEHPYHGLIGVKLARQCMLKLIVHAHNIEYHRFREMGKWWWPFLFLLERYTYRHADLSLFKTQEDMTMAIRKFDLDPALCMIVPYGIERYVPPSDEEKKHGRQKLIERYQLTPDTKILLFTGTLDYAPNAQALLHCVEQVLPELEQQTTTPFILLVTGRNQIASFQYLHQLKHPRYIYAGEVDDIATYFIGSDLLLNPVSSGGGIRVKVMEALSHGLPVVSYRTGAAGIDVNLTGTMLSIAEDRDVKQFVQLVMDQWQRKEYLPEAFYECYHWSAITSRVAERINKH